MLKLKKMKKTILLLMITSTTIGTMAQSKKIPVGGYGAGIAEITQVNGKSALNIGAYGGVLINHRLLIGAAGNNVFFKQTVNNRKENFQFNYYGLYTEYRLMPKKNIGVSVAVTGAMGWQENSMQSPVKDVKKDGKLTYVIQPKLGLNVRVTNFMQVQAYGSYRITGNTKSNYYTSKNYNGASGGISLVFGSF
jgi:hypothetical protein